MSVYRHRKKKTLWNLLRKIGCPHLDPTWVILQSSLFSEGNKELNLVSVFWRSLWVNKDSSAVPSMLHRYSTYMYLTVLSTLPYKIHVGTEYLHVLECSYLHACYIIVKFLKFSSFFEKKICFWPVTFMSLELTCTQFLTRKNLLSQYPLCCVAQIVSTKNAWRSLIP